VHTLVIPQMPAHTHTYNDAQTAGVNTFAAGGNLGVGNTGSTGGNQPHPNVQPSLVTNFIIKT
jgi:microcystin-dependent protein